MIAFGLSLLVTVCCILCAAGLIAQDKIGALEFKGGDSAFYRRLARTVQPNYNEIKSDNYYFQVDVSPNNKIRIFEKTGNRNQTTELLITILYKLACGLKNPTDRKQSIIVPVFLTMETKEDEIHMNPDTIPEEDFKKKWASKKQTYLLPLKIIAYAPIRCYNHMYFHPASL